VESSGPIPLLTCLIQIEWNRAILQNRIFALDSELTHSKKKFAGPLAFLLSLHHQEPSRALLLVQPWRGGRRVAENELFTRPLTPTTLAPAHTLLMPYPAHRAAMERRPRHLNIVPISSLAQRQSSSGPTSTTATRCSGSGSPGVDFGGSGPTAPAAARRCGVTNPPRGLLLCDG
jgi:hypothetical protein